MRAGGETSPGVGPVVEALESPCGDPLVSEGVEQEGGGRILLECFPFALTLGVRQAL